MPVPLLTQTTIAFIWDFDRTMQSIDGRDDNPTQWDGTGDSSRTWNDSRYPWWGRALTNPDFRQAHTDLWQELRKTTFSTDNIESIIDEGVVDDAGRHDRRGDRPSADHDDHPERQPGADRPDHDAPPTS